MILIEYLAIIGILFMGYFIGRIIEAWLIGSWNYPKKDAISTIPAPKEVNNEM